ncbi:cytidylyltransferase domain-containing protein [Acetivibrio mesophilus]|uniref:Acylneuraminate cytidylyltransferase n=1 Tax=Acetivibrio mesophilus TaxID=2487273 RepID=A0A4Q0I4U5_9FIRM|nr:glycosyltransferase family protein [Acetivibrio mesophilus]ODM27336.1 acylneuraminate cytidylyltransferase [Clostridium sp. Bc-iso-3]RXE58827.1 acylneuraminate cytidylyltransferase [Acetivibrio mesophilus]HHV28939.1 NTP transferase domain-containing protein [Clostridium sp.]
MKIGAIVQTRMGSTRLPGKVMLDLCGKPVIDHVIDRLKQSKLLNEIIIATTALEADRVIVDQAKKNKVKWFCGSEDDVLSRYYYAAKENNLDTVVRITSDCPLIDPVLLDKIVEFYISNNYTLVTNAGNNLTQRTFPRGLDVEVFSFRVLEDAFYNATKSHQREHVTPYMYESYGKDIYYYKNDMDYSNLRWTLDTNEDFELIAIVYDKLYDRYDGKFGFEEVLDLMKMNPELCRINANVEQKKLV